MAFIAADFIYSSFYYIPPNLHSFDFAITLHAPCWVLHKMEKMMTGSPALVDRSGPLKNQQKGISCNAEVWKLETIKIWDNPLHFRQSCI